MVLSRIKSAMCQFFQLDKVILLDISVPLTSEMIENHDFFFFCFKKRSHFSHNSEQSTIQNSMSFRLLDKMSVAAVCLYIYLFILIIYC